MTIGAFQATVKFRAVAGGQNRGLPDPIAGSKILEGMLQMFRGKCYPFANMNGGGIMIDA
jgi:hypothetical protein